MSILIKGMEMPPVGTGKVIMIDSDGDVWTAGKDECTIIAGAKAIPVPPHGRLIDADALRPYMLNEHYKYRLVYDADEVAKAPTIIPAEETLKEDE